MSPEKPRFCRWSRCGAMWNSPMSALATHPTNHHPGLSAHAKPGQKVAIVGPTGAGKTTLVNLLMRFYELNSGEIRIDGKNIADLTRENVHDLFCMVLQDTWLFEGTIRENIVYSKQGVSDAEVQAAHEAMGLDHFSAAASGYDTPPQRPRQPLRRSEAAGDHRPAMIENAPLLILDEATPVDTRPKPWFRRPWTG